MDRLEPIRIALRRPAMRVFIACAALVGAGFFALHVSALMQEASSDAELSALPMKRPPPPEVRASDGFVPLVDEKLRTKLGNPREIVYEWWSEPRPFDLGTFRGWAVRFRFRAEGARALCCCGGTQVAIMSDNFVDSIVTEQDVRDVAGDAADPFLGEAEPTGTDHR
jgi:hypothetical protein